MDRKKDRRGNLRVLPAVATPENAPRLVFCETQKCTMEVLAVPSKMENMFLFNVRLAGISLRFSYPDVFRDTAGNIYRTAVFFYA